MRFRLYKSTCNLSLGVNSTTFLDLEIFEFINGTRINEYERLFFKFVMLIEFDPSLGFFNLNIFIPAPGLELS